MDFVPGESNNNSSDQPRELLQQWSAAIQTVAKHITPLLLSFALTFQSADLETAKALLESIECPPQLRRCALSIGPHRDTQLRSFVRVIGAQKMGSVVANPAPFPFGRLPKELRLKILQETDLVQRAYPSSAYGSIYMERYSD